MRNIAANLIIPIQVSYAVSEDEAIDAVRQLAEKAMAKIQETTRDTPVQVVPVAEPALTRITPICTVI